MVEDYCTQLSKIPSNKEIHLPGGYVCKITGRTCIAAEFKNPDFGNPASAEQWAYDKFLSKNCPAYNSTEEIANVLKKNILVLEKGNLEKRAIKLQEKIKGIDSKIPKDNY